MELFIFQTGIIRCKRHNITLNQGFNEPFDSPVPWYLIRHPRGDVVIDGGNAVECATDARTHWGKIVDDLEPVMEVSEGCVNALARLGIGTDAVRYVLQSHLHLDHTGAVGRFPQATYLVQRREYEYAFAPDWFSAGAYVRKDFDRPNLDWFFLEGSQTDFYDLFGDGTVVIIYTPGHSPGHQSFLLNLPRTGAILLAVDAAYTRQHWDEQALPGFNTCAVEAVRSVQKLRLAARRSGAQVLPGHDPEVLATFRQAPASYT